MNNRLLQAALALALSAPLAAHAIFLDPDGAGGPETAKKVTSLDWVQTSALAKNGNQAFIDFIDTGDAQKLDIRTHATLGVIRGAGGANITPTGLGSDFEITMVMGFGEELFDASPNFAGQRIAGFRFDPTADNFVRLYYDPTPDANDLDGTGFNDDVLIFESTVLGFDNASAGNFSVALDGNGDPIVEVLDQHIDGTPPADDWLGSETVVGSGNNPRIDIDAAGATLNSDFWSGLLTGFAYDNVSQLLAYQGVDPSRQYTEEDDSLYTVWDGTPAGLATKTIGDINGNIDPNAGNVGADIIFQTDYNSPLTGIPLPSSVLLMGLGLLALGGASVRRRAG